MPVKNPGEAVEHARGFFEQADAPAEDDHDSRRQSRRDRGPTRPRRQVSEFPLLRNVVGIRRIRLHGRREEAKADS